MRVGRVKRPGPPPEAGWSTTELTGEEQEEKDCGSDRVKRPDPSLTAGGSTTELTEEEKDCGFDRVKRPDPSLTAGGSTTELTEEEKDCGFDRVKRPDPSLTAGGSTTELTEEEKDCGFDRVKRPDPSLTAGGSTTELTESAGSGRGTDDDASWLGTSTETSQLAATGSISSKRIGIVPEAKDNRGILPKKKPWHHWPTKNHFLKSCLLRRD